MTDTLKIKKLHPDAIIPTQGHDGDLGYDLYSIVDHMVFPWGSEYMESNDDKKIVKIPTGISIQFPKGWGGFIKERSSMGLKGIEVRGGVIDNGYTGEIIVIVEVLNHTLIKKHQKIAQLVPIPVTNWNIEEVEDHDETERGEKRFGSTGK